ncbi:LuxR C-terminal-related transcriptional regulator [Paenibacillus senegalensis]|uniref:LuxR C-terminal-related transcriptional regulator n=1 Tax=Paenibacillus senegalensis TaxID=1465766 RepID=UPI00028944DC|nr:LuxR C-terminal-related transcriptional regulator [Paenibacillus senegalensis]
MIVPSKFQFPLVPEGYVKRPRLDIKLQNVCKRKLTCIVAPPGSGKTTLVSAWKEQAAFPVACIVLEEADNHLLRFWLHIIAAIHQASPGLDDGLTDRFIEQFLEGPGQALSGLLEVYSLLPAPLVIVLDDYHVIEVPEIHAMLTDFIRNMPSSLHMIVISRTEIPLKLTKGMLYQIGWPDIAFTDNEAKRFYRGALKLQVTDRQVRHWQEQTEGWALGMRMLGAARTHDGQETEEVGQQPGEIVTTDEQVTVCDRMIGELLSRQEPGTIRFLLLTSLPERINQSLTLELTGNAEAEIMFAALEKENLFFQRLHDGSRVWYRYHPLIAQKLRDRLRQQDEPLWLTLQWKTGRWLENNGYPMEAMEHYMKGFHFKDAGRLLERLFNQFVLKEAWTLQRYFAMLPEELIQNNPKLFLSYLFFAAGNQETGRTLERLDAIERRVAAAAQGDFTAEQREYFMRVIVLMRAYVSIFKHDLEGLVRYLNMYLEQGYPPSDEIFAYIDYEAPQYSRLRSFPGVAGSLCRAKMCFEPIVQSWRSIRCYNTAYYAIGYAELQYELNRLNESERYAGLARSIGDELGSAALSVPAAILQARLLYSKNQLRKALQTLHEVRAGLRHKECEYWTPILEASETKLHLLSPEGDNQAGGRYLTAYSGQIDDNSSSNELLCALVHARALIAEHRFKEARSRLKRIQIIVTGRGLLLEQLEVYMLQALLFENQGKRSLAARAFGKAVHLSAADGHIRLYIDEGERMQRIASHYHDLRQAYRVKERQVSIRYVNQILFAFEAQAAVAVEAKASEENPLSEMEKRVLLYLSQSYTSKEAAASIGVSTGTINTYIQRIFTKLQVHKRKDAVLKAYKLGWLKNE